MNSVNWMILVVVTAANWGVGGYAVGRMVAERRFRVAVTALVRRARAEGAARRKARAADGSADGGAGA
ncbi:hypothetical protein AB0383_19555 [Amycolatopsis sp. NPDC051373]|uniref:hypothetical protein n=1 Tax=Amycolatopsis sp. NPDC051373 TaxID=3155801 RepID=UPI00344C6C5F